jgi:hypothetical protein
MKGRVETFRQLLFSDLRQGGCAAAIFHDAGVEAGNWDRWFIHLLLL